MTATAPAATPSPPPDPVLAALSRIEARLAAVEEVARAIAPLAALATTAPAAVAVATDTFDGVAQRLGAAGVDLDERMRSVIRAIEVATAPRAVNGLASLVESHLLEPSALAVVSQLAVALAAPGEAKPVGTWGMMKALRDPDVQRALGFGLAIARRFGQQLASGGVDACRDRLDAAAPTKLLEAP
ncbi:MAG: DUF1641 domain-containing protein [Kofleriaceae bacterium]|jgi:hypothetical protein|nr:DUF1641 domain-containing protein [Kofleriaceae bacterium]MBP9172288.1 DUF1641 domain-containing protein [Kofleriaceae bacterium]MBP9860343.1 DUF1641 domain-containing protein [Kofleriaceae bacterium]